MYVQVVEYGPPVLLDLTPVQSSALRSASQRWASALRLGREPLLVDDLPSGTRVRARDVAGFVRVGDVTIDVVPKFLDPATAGASWRRSLWRFLAFAQGIDSILVTTSGVEVEQQGVADLLADLFVSSVETAAWMGLPLGYEQQRRLSPYMAGRIDTRRIGRLAIPDGKLPVEIRRLTRDTEIGRLLKWAALELARLVESPARRGRLRAWSAGIPEIADRPPRFIRNVNTTRQFPHLTVAVDIAMMLLADHWGEYGHGALNLPGFLWRSETLFEKAMLRLARKSAHPLGMTAEKRSHTLVTESVGVGKRVLATTPDIDVHKAGVTRVLLDAKYKVLTGQPSIDDVYQVLAGGRACDVERVALVYPGSGQGLAVRNLVPLGMGATTKLDLIEVGLSSFENAAGVKQLVSDLTEWIQL